VGSMLNSLLPLAREHKLSAYDAAYLDLAIREGLPLATLDKGLKRAAVKAGVSIYPESA
jgi:predicted nucleic acid-binding protein